ncbi:MAG: HTH domain-containing protein [Streptococcus dysgalactiae]|nr:HTH domain-containing protein [Streptococcus dysgalactiae]
MTYTHLTTTELVMIEAYYKEGITVSNICQSLKRSRQTIYKVIAYLKAGHTAYDYYKDYKANKKRCGRLKTQLTQSEQDFIQRHLELNWSLDVVKGMKRQHFSVQHL